MTYHRFHGIDWRATGCAPGGPGRVANSGSPRLVRLLVLAAAPARPHELAGEGAALKAFRSSLVSRTDFTGRHIAAATDPASGAEVGGSCREEAR
jgi:hypothetical protein